MKRLTTDHPMDNVEIALNLFYIKDRETWVRNGGPAPQFRNISLFDYTRCLIRAHIPDVEIPENNDDLSAMMGEWLFDDADSAEGTIATLYTAAWALAELRHRLAAYENTGLEPEEIERILDAYGRGHTLRSESGQRLEIVQEIKTDRLRELAKAESTGRLVVLPCRMDTTVYDIRRFYRGKKAVRQEIVSGQIDHFVIGEAQKPIATVCLQGNEWADYEPDDLILTREEAEAALKGGTNETDSV